MCSSTQKRYKIEGNVIFLLSVTFFVFGSIWIWHVVSLWAYYGWHV